jgi:hypothetical protein
VLPSTLIGSAAIERERLFSESERREMESLSDRLFAAGEEPLANELLVRAGAAFYTLGRKSKEHPRPTIDHLLRHLDEVAEDFRPLPGWMSIHSEQSSPSVK